MNRDELRRMLERLHGELGRVDAVESGLAERLRSLRRDIEDTQAKGTPSASLRGRLEEAVAHFEAQHPTLASRLAEVIDTLALYGL